MVTFETKVYEKDWRYILRGNYLDKMIKRCNYNFKVKTVFINNVKNKEKVIKYAEKKVKKGIIDSYYFVDDFSDLALEYFNIKKDSFKGGYYYSISELVSIYLCKTDYLLHFSSDSFIEDSNENWINKSIEIFKKRNDIVVANPVWNFDYKMAKKESFTEISDFYLGYGFSDQCYLIKIAVFKADIYNETNNLSNRYPEYGGELFEKRVDSFMRNNKLYRITSKYISYSHKNFSKSRYIRILNMISFNFFIRYRFF
ncbi:MAG: hypothetical protein Q7J14_00605 [Candidatus Magasanikbacteria bacterium]|nr:hypothetical protein [Candidatus Magasanikbacteria bacterium]